MARREQGSPPLHEALLADPAKMLAVYDQAAQQLIDAIRPEGYFADWEPDAPRWPQSQSEGGPVGLEGLRERARIVGAVYDGVPERRDTRLTEAYTQFQGLTSAYHEGTRLYLQLKSAYIANGVGDEQDFLQLYQSLYLEALAKAELFSPDVGEASLERVGITRVPLSHAQATAEALSAVDTDDDPRWSETYACSVDGSPVQRPLRELLQDVAQRTLSLIAAGGLLSTRYNYLSNLAWFGSAVWKALTDVESALCQLEGVQKADRRTISGLLSDVRRGQGMMVEFFQAHQEDPTRLRPESYWYGQEYSYLTRDMADLSVEVVRKTNTVIDRCAGRTPSLPAQVDLAPLLSGEPTGRFTEYPHVGRNATLSPSKRSWRFARWVKASARLGKAKQRLLKVEDRDTRQREAWEANLAWGLSTLQIFGVRLQVVVDPRFRAAAEELGLGEEGRKVLFLPTHQSLLDHATMYCVLQSPELLEAMGWEDPVPCVILARTGLARSGLRLGSWNVTQFGLSAEEFDRLMEEVDGYVMLERSGATGHTTPQLAAALETRPGIIYPMATTAAFSCQSFPLQHAIFAHIPQDVVIVPMALRGIHSIWPKCPAGNRDINPGLVEVFVSPPMLGETTLLPRRRSLRIQAEAAALFQAVHLATLLNAGPTP